MTKLSRRSIDPQTFGGYVNNLWSAFTLMDSKEDIRSLFKDLFTRTEYKMFAKRLEIARRLLKGESYVTIQHDMKVTPNTVHRINEVLAEKGDGYKKADEKLTGLENKYWQKQKEITRDIEHPFLAKAKAHHKTLGGALLKAGLQVVDKTITKKLKHNSAKKRLENND